MALRLFTLLLAGATLSFIVNLLLGARATTEWSDNRGVTALHHATTKKDADIAGLLLEGVASCCLTDPSGRTPLHCAVSLDHCDLVRLMSGAGADSDAASCHGMTALMLACHHGLVETVRLLLAAGARQDLRANNGLTPLLIASRNGRVDIARLLLATEVHLWALDEALRVASQFGHAAVALLVIEARARKYQAAIGWMCHHEPRSLIVVASEQSVPQSHPFATQGESAYSTKTSMNGVLQSRRCSRDEMVMLRSCVKGSERARRRTWMMGTMD